MLCRKCLSENKDSPMPKGYEKMFDSLVWFACDECGEGNPVNIKTDELKKHREPQANDSDR